MSWAAARAGFVMVTTGLMIMTGPALAQRYTLLTTDPGDDSHPDVSRDGQTVVFESNRSGTWHLYRMNIDGSHVTQLTDDVLEDFEPAISPDGLTVAFRRQKVNPATSNYTWSWLCVVPIDGGPVIHITPENTLHYDKSPAWSVDGSRVFFCRSDAANTYVGVVPATGGPGEPLLAPVGMRDRVLVSPDGVHLAYEVLTRSGNSDRNVFEAVIDRPTIRAQITFGRHVIRAMDLADGGNKLLYSIYTPESSRELWELNRSGDRKEQVTFDGNGDSSARQLWACYDPLDSRRIIYASQRVRGDLNIWLLDRSLPPLITKRLDVDNVAGLPGGPPIPVTLTLLNDMRLTGFEFRVADMAGIARVTAARGTGRGLPLEVHLGGAGTSHVVATMPITTAVDPGEGAVLELDVVITGDAPPGRDIPIAITDVFITDRNGNRVVVPSNVGMIHMTRRPGDLTFDNRTDPGDLVRLTDIVVGRGARTSSEDFALADCNRDGRLDHVDLDCLFDIVSPAGMPASLLPPWDFRTTIHFDLLDFVRAVEVEFSPRTGIGDDIDDLAPLTVTTRTREDGTVVLLAWDPSGRGLARGAFEGLTTRYWPIAARAWGDGGRRLPLVLERNILTIGDGSAPPIPIVTAVPTPFRDETTIRWRMISHGAATIQVFDVRGAIRRSWSRAELSAGDYLFTWDGRDDQGEPVASGIYFARVALPDGEHHLRLVRLIR